MTCLLAGSDITLGDFANSPDARARLKKSQSSGFLKADELICEDWAEADDETFSTLQGKYLKGKCHEILTRFFFDQLPWSPNYFVAHFGVFLITYEDIRISGCTTGVSDSCVKREYVLKIFVLVTVDYGYQISD